MKQFTKEEARAILESRAWTKWTDNQILRLQLFQENLCMPFGTFHCALERYLGRPVYTHTIEHQRSRLLLEFLGNNMAPTLEEIMLLVPANITRKNSSIELEMDRILNIYRTQSSNSSSA